MAGSRFRAACPLSAAALAVVDDMIAFPAPGSQKEQSRFHCKAIQALCFGSRSVPRRRLFSASSDALCMWQLTVDLGTVVIESEELIKEEVGPVAWISVNSADTWIACAVNDAVHVLHVKTGRSIVLQGHLGRVSGCEFFTPLPDAPDLAAWLISVSDDRTFKIWDIQNASCLYQSTILSPSLLTTVALSPDRFCLGSEDGILRFFEWTPRRGNPCEPRCLKVVNAADHLKQAMQAKVTKAAEQEPEVTYVHSRQPRPRNITPITDDENDADEVEQSAAILALSYSVFSPSWRDRVDGSQRTDLQAPGLKSNRHLVVGVASGIIVLEAATYERLAFVAFDGGDAEVAGAYAIAKETPRPMTCHIAIGNRFSGNVRSLDVVLAPPQERSAAPPAFDIPQSLQSVVKTAVAANLKGDWGNNAYADCLTKLAKVGIRSLHDLATAAERGSDILSSVPAFVQSALEQASGRSAAATLTTLTSFSAPKDANFDAKSPLKPKTPKPLGPPATRSGRSSVASKRGAPIKVATAPPPRDKPVTFHDTVKSSGYLRAPQNTMFSPRTSSATTRWAKVGKAKVPARLQPIAPPPAYHNREANIKAMKPTPAVYHNASITCIKSSASGKSIASASADRTVRYHRVTSPADSVKSLMGHDAPVTTVSWSALKTGPFDQLLLTSAMDGTVKLWAVGASEPLLTFREIAGSGSKAVVGKLPATRITTGGSHGTPAQATTPKTFMRDISTARFFHQDRLIAIPSGPALHLYTYALEKPPAGSVQPNLNYNTYRLATTLTASAHNVTTVACINSFRSHLVISAMSDKTVQIWDVAQCTSVRTVPHAQERAVHCIALPDYNAGDAGAAATYFTAAVTDSIKMWDLRAEKAVLHLHGHVNRHAKVACCVSPCGRYLVTGSEDNHAYLYDVRQGRVLDRLGGHSDVASAVDFNPVQRVITTAGYDGKVCSFTY
ncbi:WD40-repeat-containing domain protein [Fimicolochytrium jonesii]|uniref:WD40-repeat-containing domain protein n=1 Tax=Fimicolochytrium jonesii TaxID=1396493 RepID=UPI0022FE1603|nr:WD40-repeat-containing domain protein [Fimicolochytrium jonesii]KAI8827082.1 WD40-repeat-containing domain protein [Fimicolochytrium jonesii]